MMNDHTSLLEQEKQDLNVQIKKLAAEHAALHPGSVEAVAVQTAIISLQARYIQVLELLSDHRRRLIYWYRVKPAEK